VPPFAMLQPSGVCVVADLRGRPQLPTKVGSLSARIRATSCRRPLGLRLGPAGEQISTGVSGLYWKIAERVQIKT
jgi:hypothetical protein